MKPVICAYYELWSLSPAMLIGTSPKVRIICGVKTCKYEFSHRFSMGELARGNPSTLCPKCGTPNTVPIIAE